MNDTDNRATFNTHSDAAAHEAREAGRRELMMRFAHLAANAGQEVDKYDLSTLACTD